MTTPRRVKVERGVYQRPGQDGYEIGWRDAQGKQRWRKVNGGIRAARAALAEEVARRGRGERVAANPRLRFSDAADAWQRERVSRLRPTTQQSYRYALRHVAATFGSRRLGDITTAEVAAYVAARQRTGAKGWTVKGELVVLGGVFQHAARHLGYAGANPVALLDRVERPSNDDAKAARILTVDERIRLLAAIDEPFRPIFQLAASTGARLGETLGLVWGDVDLEGRTVTFTHQLDRGGRRVPLKTKRSRRCIEIGAALSGELRQHKMAAAGSGDHDLVFVNRQRRPHDHRNVGGRVLSRAVDLAAIAAPAPTFHSLRHTHASELIADGWDIESVSSRLGHADVSVTLQVYTHAFEAAGRSGERRRRLDAMEARVEAAGGTEGHRQDGRVVPISSGAAK